MKSHLTLSVLVFLGLGCGAPEPDAEASTAGGDAQTGVAEAAGPEAPTTSTQANAASGDPCSVLASENARYDASGNPVAYTFEYPSGLKVAELFASSATTIDLTKDLDDDNLPDFVLRFGHVVTNPMDNPERMVEVWKQQPKNLGGPEEIMELDVEGRTMYLARVRMGEMVSFQALFPDVTSDSKAWLVSGGITNAPDECEEQAIAAVERVMRSFQPNPEIGSPPAG